MGMYNRRVKFGLKIPNRLKKMSEKLAGGGGFFWLTMHNNITYQRVCPSHGPVLLQYLQSCRLWHRQVPSRSRSVRPTTPSTRSCRRRWRSRQISPGVRHVPEPAPAAWRSPSTVVLRRSSAPAASGTQYELRWRPVHVTYSLIICILLYINTCLLLSVICCWWLDEGIQ